ncbi:MAG: hypothetical protein COZ72_03840 [Elusimicrobia bacterium CG_4_8_14_3_um_filter_50_9]|nr:MAG: hypothetical protein COZ72_03840 [Elusimicrobia bacterium CG_4_8_14_3_um_filter_50_9]
MKLMKLYRPALFFVFLCVASVITQAFAEELEDGNLIERMRFWDSTHDFISKKLHAPVEWFDDFFSDERVLEEVPARSILRLRSDLIFSEGGETFLRTFLHASVRLPKMRKKLKIIISDENEDPVPVSAGEIVKTGARQARYGDRADVGLRYSVLDTMLSRLHFGGGMKAETPLNPYARAYYRHLFPLTEVSQIRFSATARRQRLDGWRKTLQLGVERMFAESNILRWGNSVIFEDPDVDYHWESYIGFQQQISERNALSYTLGMSGISDDRHIVENYRASVRFRRNFYKGWVFYELEPANDWPRDDFGEYSSVASFTFRLEVQFGY